MADQFGLEASLKKLQQRWQQTRTAWDDPVSREFEHTFLAPLAEQMQRTQRELERLMYVIEQAQRHMR